MICNYERKEEKTLWIVITLNDELRRIVILYELRTWMNFLWTQMVLNYEPKTKDNEVALQSKKMNMDMNDVQLWVINMMIIILLHKNNGENDVLNYLELRWSLNFYNIQNENRPRVHHVSHYPLLDGCNIRFKWMFY